ncbi:EAL domain-containing protein [Variovorax sp. LT1R16]|uniref:EAL domain-containing protein n=1 Tax=Variovorax sp. LT1R16 TaxID=3443728 RepID=UPI003F47CD4D
MDFDASLVQVRFEPCVGLAGALWSERAFDTAPVALLARALASRLARRATLESDLRGALIRAELSVAYQPIVALPGRRCVGMEALVRWRHPTLEPVPAQEFVAIAEEVGLIQALGRLVLFEACRAFASWKHRFGDAGPASISVNVSRASWNDFGTGYSSLATLHLLPIDVLKIDRSFVMQVETSPHYGGLIKAVILVARSLGVLTVAEGIETEGQAAAVARLNCDKGQGYLYAQPMHQ